MSKPQTDVELGLCTMSFREISSDIKSSMRQCIVVRVMNRNEKPVKHLQLSIENDLGLHFVCPPFDLSPGKVRNIDVGWVLFSEEGQPAHGNAYSEVDGNWLASNEDLLLTPGRYRLTLYSENAPLTSIFVQLKWRNRGWSWHRDRSVEADLELEERSGALTAR
jgi:hypothetical protein